MSPKVNDGLLWSPAEPNYFLLKRPLPIGGWFFNKDTFLDDMSKDYSSGWGWAKVHEKDHEGAALVAPLPILFWEKE